MFHLSNAYLPIASMFISISTSTQASTTSDSTKYMRLTTQTEKCFKGYKTVIATKLKTNLFLWKVHPAGGGPLAAQRVHAGPGWAQLIE